MCETASMISRFDLVIGKPTNGLSLNSSFVYCVLTWTRVHYHFVTDIIENPRWLCP